MRVCIEPALTSLRRKHRTEPIPPEPHRLVADVDVRFLSPDPTVENSKTQQKQMFAEPLGSIQVSYIRKYMIYVRFIYCILYQSHYIMIMLLIWNYIFDAETQ